jgi:hypothetical protein
LAHAATQQELPPRRPDAPDPSIFGEDSFSDKSLDEVILAYLAEDKEPQ